MRVTLHNVKAAVEAELLARDDAGELLGVNLRDGACPGQVLVAVSVTDYAGLS